MDDNSSSLTEEKLTDDDCGPGAAAATVFAASESFADLDSYNASFENSSKKALPSGIISRILSGEESEQVCGKVSS